MLEWSVVDRAVMVHSSARWYEKKWEQFRISQVQNNIQFLTNLDFHIPLKQGQKYQYVWVHS